MTRFSGRRTDVGISKEDTRGTTAASVDYWLPYASYSYNEKVLKVRDESGLGVLATPQGADIVKEWNEGELVMNIRDQSIGLLLLALFGSETFSSDTPEADVGQHTFTLALSNQHQSLTVWKKNPVETLASGNAVVGNASLNCVLDQYVRMSFGLIGKKFGNDSETVSYVSENKFRPQDVAIKLAATENELSAASSITTFRSLNINFNKNVEDYQGLGSKTPVDWLNRDFEVSGDAEILFENTTRKDYVLLNQSRAMSVKLTNSGVTIGSSTNPNLEFVFDELEFDSFELDESNPNIVVLSLTFNGLYNMSNSRMVRAILQNSVNSAY